MVRVPLPEASSSVQKSSKFKIKKKSKLKLIQNPKIGRKVNKVGKNPTRGPKNAQPQEQQLARQLQIVPWASSSEWEQVCALFNNGEYRRVIDEIRVWNKRVPAIPIGVEATLYLLQAIMYDGPSTPQWSEEIARSLYSLAIIRYLNHVSHLATRDMADIDGSSSSTLPMSKLAAHINVPEWIVNLRHEASHGANVPSLEILRLAAEFVRTWLKENYWIPRDVEDEDWHFWHSNGSQIVLKSKSEAKQAEFAQKVAQHLAPFVAGRVYKLRKMDRITDPEILQLLNLNQGETSVDTNQAIAILKSEIEKLLRSDPRHACALLAEEIVPPADVLRDFASVLDREEEPFSALVLIWSPVLKHLQKKPLLVQFILEPLIERHSESEEEETCHVVAHWIEKFLQMLPHVRGQGPSSSSRLLRALLAAPPKPSSTIFLETLHSFMEPDMGLEKMQKLKELSDIWIGEDDRSRKNSNGVPGVLFSIENLAKGDEIDMDIDPRAEEAASNPSGGPPWSMDPRASSFWSRAPVGLVL